LYVHGAGALNLSAYKDENDFSAGVGGAGGSGGPSIGNPGQMGFTGLALEANF
jgi:hypothetical protein